MATANRGARLALHVATYNARLVADMDAPRAARRCRCQQMRVAFAQNKIHLVGLQETVLKQGTCNADGYWMVSTGAQGKKCGVTLAMNAVEPYATTAGRDLCFQPKHVYVLHMGHRVLIARIRAPLLDAYVYVLHAPCRGADGVVEVPVDQ